MSHYHLPETIAFLSAIPPYPQHTPLPRLLQLKQIMHDEVSETENIRKNLSIERMIVDGCELLLDVNQVFVRQGTLIQVICDKPRSSRSRLGTFGGSARERKEAIRQVFLFTNHLLITARTNNGRLRLVKNYGKISLVECTLVEDTTAELFSNDDDGYNNLDTERKTVEHTCISGGSRTAVCTPSAPLPSLPLPPPIGGNSGLTYSQQPSQHSLTSILAGSTRGLSGLSNTDIPGPSIATSTNVTSTISRLPNRSDSGPPIAFGGRRLGSSESGQRPASGSILTSYTSAFPGTLNNSLPSGDPVHRHSTSLCLASVEAEPSTIGTRGAGPQQANESGIGLSTISTTANTTTTTGATVVGANTTNQTNPAPTSVPLIHRFSSNFAMLSSIGTAALTQSSNNNATGIHSTCVGTPGTNMDKADYGNLDFRIVWEPKNGQPTSIWLVASTLQEKAAWCSDISQCIEQLHYGDLLNSAQSDVSSVAMPQSIRSDPRLFKDDVDIKFSHTLNSCKVPQIRHASVGRLLDRLTDARFLSIDFLNTFLLTYRVFTTGLTVICALQNVLANPETEGAASSVLQQQQQQQQQQQHQHQQHPNVQHNNSSHLSGHGDVSGGRDQGYSRVSESIGFVRLPILEEQLTRVEDGQSRSEELVSEGEDCIPSDQSECVTANAIVTTAAVATITTTSTTIATIATSTATNTNIATAATVGTSLSTAITTTTIDTTAKTTTTSDETTSIKTTMLSGNQDQSIKRRPERLQTTRPLSISVAPNNLSSPSFLKPTSTGDNSRMFRSEITYERGTDTEITTRHSVSSTQFICKSTDPNSTERSYSLIVTGSASTTPPMINTGASGVAAAASVAALVPHPVPASAPPPPPLIPRSPVYSGLFNMREDPPLELPILPEVRKTERSGQTKERPRSAVENEPDGERNLAGTHCRLAPLASCEVIADETEQCVLLVDKDENLEENKCVKKETKTDKSMDVSTSDTKKEGDSCAKQIDAGSETKEMDKESIGEGSSAFETKVDDEEEVLEEIEKPETPLNQSWTVLSSANVPEIGLNFEGPNESHGTLFENGVQERECLAVEGKLKSDSLPTSRPASAHSSITESLDLATRRTRRAKDASHKWACETLAKTAMLAALHCPGGLVRLRPTDDSTDEVGRYAKLGLRSSPSSPVKQQQQHQKQQSQQPNGTTRNKVTKTNLSLQLSPKECPSPARSPNKFTAARGFFSRGSTNHRSSSDRHSDTEQRKSSTMSDRGTELTNSLHTQTNSYGNGACTSDEVQKRPKSATVRSTLLIETKSPGEKPTRHSNADDHVSEKNIQDRLMGTVKLMACTFGGTEELQRARQASDRLANEPTVVERTGSLTPRSSFAQLQSGGGPDYARGSVVSWSGVSETPKPKRPSVFSCPDTEVMSPRPGIVPPIFGDNSTPMRTRAGAVVTSSRRSKRRSSNTAAAQAFAVATAGSASPLAAAGIMGLGPGIYRSGFRFTAGTASSSVTNVCLKSASAGGGSSTWNTSGNMQSNVASGTTGGVFALRYCATRNSPGSATNGAQSSSATSAGSTVAATVTAAGASPAAVPPSASSLVTTSGQLTSAKVTTCTPIHWSQPLPSRVDQQNRRSTIMATASCLRVLNVVRHWITKFPEDFDSDPILKDEMKTLLELLVCCPHLLLNDQKAAGQLLRQMVCDQLVQNRIDLDAILTPVQIPSEKNFDTLSALDISEQLTFLDFQIFRSIRSEELLNQSWMKPDKEDKAKHVLLVCKRFNEVSRLVVSEIISRTDLNDRVNCIDKWVAIADICRCMQNYNGVLQICAALVNSSVYRLRRTWERVSKQTKQSIDRLQMLVASDGRFKSMREALHR
ncbi:unnamed protein product [Echinostoma caproni]|uniref:Ras-GEF domain-containing protein n=1 Tax=Echinostoma caproni TaxID=27848 RepID=A0A183A990_9TREM|nr:unnamed protein product [Echinostoma caproni]